MVKEESPKQTTRQDSSKAVQSNQNGDALFSPRFKSVAAMAGWDEEAILIASLVVEDTPDRDSKHKKRSALRFRTPPSTNTSRRKRRVQRRSPVPLSVPILNLDDEESVKEESAKTKKNEGKAKVSAQKKTKVDVMAKENAVVSSSSSALPCMDKLRDELSCAICLEICYEPSTTSCGHSFCKKCLRSAADKCGKKCPKCRQLISNGRSCTVNTVLWNTIQLLFPQEVEARKAAGAALISPPKSKSQIPEKAFYGNIERNIRPPVSSSSWRRSSRNNDIDEADAARIRRESVSRLRETSNVRRSNRRRETPSQNEDSALALRLQREEFMMAFRGNGDERMESRSGSTARARLVALAATRAFNNQNRN